MPYSCFPIVTNKTGVFDPVAEHCIVLAMPRRAERAIRNIRNDAPHSHITFQLNPGMESKPDLCDKTTRADICHALDAAFRMSLAKRYSTVLVLEDDFFLGSPTEVAAARKAAQPIAEFLSDREFDTYNLGRVAFCGWPCGKGSWRALLHGAAHGVVYSERFMRAFTEQHAKDPASIARVGNDAWWNRADMVHYVYKDPLVFQTFPVTENRRMWTGPLVDIGIRALGLDVCHQPGYSVLSCISKLPFAIALLCIVAAAARLVTLPSHVHESPDPVAGLDHQHDKRVHD